MKILLGAYSCNPRQGSEPAVGWGWLEAIKNRHDVDVIAGSYQRAWIKQEVGRREDEFRRVRFHFVEPPGFRRVENSDFWNWQARHPLLTPAYHWYYRRWLRAAYRAAAELNRREHFDLVHQLTMVGFRFPGYLWKLDAPFVWGPIGGLDNTPWRLLPAMGVGGAGYYAARNIVNSMHKKLLRAPRRALRRASAVIAATPGIQAELRRNYGGDSVVVSEVFAAGVGVVAPSRRKASQPLRIAWIGQHQAGKALNLLLRAMARVPNSVDWRLDIFGDGPSRTRWERAAVELGVNRRCIWHGQVPRDETLRGLSDSHLLVITSLKDLTSTVVIESLAHGVPVVCPDHCGFADVINDACGIKLPIRSVNEFVSKLSDAIALVDRDEELRRRLAIGALARARDYSVEEKTHAIERIYANTIRNAGRNDGREDNPLRQEESIEAIAAEGR
jgi:glycosyltransferase involved in cell wall biosynthesis